MHRVRGLHDKLRGVVGNLSVSVSKVMQQQENEFMAAYRAHMFNVQRELQDLRNKVDEAEMAMKQNDKIMKLEHERDWCAVRACARARSRAGA